MNVKDFLKRTKNAKMRVSFLFADSNKAVETTDKPADYLKFNGAVNLICKSIKDFTIANACPTYAFLVSKHNYVELYQKCYKVCQEDGDNTNSKYVMYFANTKVYVEFLEA